MAAEGTQVPLNALSMDGNVRRHAEESLNQSQEQNLASFLLSLLGELANDEKPIDSHRLEILKNTLDERWLSVDNNIKSQVKTYLLKTLSSPISDAWSTVSQVIAKVAGIELPQNQWPELIGSLLSNIHQFPAHVNVKQATLETLGYLCEEVSPDVIGQDHVNEILIAVVQAMNASEGNNDVRLAATRALYNALGFAQANFNNDMERDYIMRVVCEATLSPEVKIRQAAFECLVSISSTYYEKLGPHIQRILNITDRAVREDEEPVALQAVEVWSSICHKEIDFLKSSESNIRCFNVIKRELAALVPMLLETLLKQEEIISEAGRTCLGLVARIVGDRIDTHVIAFIKENITKPDWRQKEAATKAIGSFLLSLSGELANDEKPIESRRLAGLILKCTLDERWLSLDNNVKSEVMTSLRNTLYSPVSDARSTASQVIAKVAGIELRQGRWPQLVRFLLSNFALFPADVKQATLETLEYLWKEVSHDRIDQDLVDALVGMVLPAVLLEMDLFYGGNNDVRLAATRALCNVLWLPQARFNDDMDPDYTMRVVREAYDSPDVNIKMAALSCVRFLEMRGYH